MIGPTLNIHGRHPDLIGYSIVGIGVTARKTVAVSSLPGRYSNWSN